MSSEHDDEGRNPRKRTAADEADFIANGIESVQRDMAIDARVQAITGVIEAEQLELRAEEEMEDVQVWTRPAYDREDRAENERVSFVVRAVEWNHRPAVERAQRDCGSAGPTDQECCLIEEWTRIRTMFTAGAHLLRETAKRARLTAFELLKTCAHPDAVWLRNVLEQGAEAEMLQSPTGAFYVESSAERLKRLLCRRPFLSRWFAVVVSKAEVDGGVVLGRAIFFASAFDRDESWKLGDMSRAAQLGYPPAQGYMARDALGETERFKWAELGAAQHDPEALYQLGHFYLNGFVCQRDHLKGTILMMNAARVGNTAAQCVRGRLLPSTDPEKTVWFHRAALNGTFNRHYTEHIVNTMTTFSWDSSRDIKRVIFVMGKLLRGVTNFDKAKLYEESIDYGAGVSGRQNFREIIIPDGTEKFTRLFTCATEAICLFEHWSRKTREAVDAWVGSAIRLTSEASALRRRRGYVLIPKDIRRLIGEYVWASRSDGLYTAPKLPSERDTVKRRRLDDGFI